MSPRPPSSDPPQSRRDVLRAVAVAGTFGVAGCSTGSGPDSDGPGVPTSTEAPGPPATTENPTGGPDERVSATPPGSPTLEAAGAWPAYRFDAGNTGFRADGRGLRDAEPYWRLRAGGTASVADGTLYNLSGGEQDYAVLARRDPATAARRSSTRLVRYGTNSPPTVRDGRVFVTTFIEAFCLAGDRDEVLWRGPEMDGIQGAPSVRDGTVFVNSGGFNGVSPHLRAFDAATGEERWRYDTDSESKSTPAVGDGGVFVSSHDGLHAVDEATGDRRFLVEEASGEWSTPAVSDGTVYTMANREKGDELLAVDAADGTVHWRVDAESMGSEPPVVAEGRVYVGAEAGVVAIDASDGSRVADLGGRGNPVARVGDVVYAVEGGTVEALDAGGEGRLWSYWTEQVQIQDTVGRNVYGVTPVDGAVYVSARDAFYGFGPAAS